LLLSVSWICVPVVDVFPLITATTANISAQTQLLSHD